MCGHLGPAAWDGVDSFRLRTCTVIIDYSDRGHKDVQNRLVFIGVTWTPLNLSRSARAQRRSLNTQLLPALHSMTDGRLDAQRARAEELFTERGVKLVYLLEGGVPEWTNKCHYGVSDRARAASVVKMTLRDGHHVIHTSSIAATAATIA